MQLALPAGLSLELTYNADAGQDEASAPSRRQGVEISAEYSPWTGWSSTPTSLCPGPLPPATSRPSVSTAAVHRQRPELHRLLRHFGGHLGPWFGGLQWRKLGAYPLEDGADPHYDSGYSEFNVDAGYVFNKHLKATVSVFNLFNSHADAAAYYYGTIKAEDQPGHLHPASDRRRYVRLSSSPPGTDFRPGEDHLHFLTMTRAYATTGPHEGCLGGLRASATELGVFADCLRRVATEVP